MATRGSQKVTSSVQAAPLKSSQCDRDDHILFSHHRTHRPNPYNGATIEPVKPMFLKFAERLRAQGVDLIIPLTHESMDDDRALARLVPADLTVPVIFGGKCL